MSVNFLLEIGIEEIPARFLTMIVEDLRAKLESALKDKSIGYVKVSGFGSMKKIIAYVDGISEKQADTVSETRGPARLAAFDADGKPTKAAEGFAASQGLNVKDLSIREMGGKEYLFAVKDRKGKKTKEVLALILPDILKSLYMPISMKWGEGDYVFIRPVHYILAILGKDIVKFTAGDIKSSSKTKGHRFLSGNKPCVFSLTADIDAYEKFQKKLGVIIDGNKRRAVITSYLAAYEKKTGHVVLRDDELINETADLTENPVLLTASFDKQFINALPEAVIATVVKKQQKCFPVKGSGDFIIVSDGKSSKNITAGYSQVVNARLADAKFFFDEDKKTSPDANHEKLRKVIYFEQAGSMWDKTVRMADLASYIAGQIGETNVEHVKRAALLSKSDLVTHLVGEFSGLAGIMGSEYAKLSGESALVAQAVYEHILPRFPGDDMPKSRVGACVALSDRVDALAACFSCGMIPSGSQDPYGLRRAAAGIVGIMLAMDIKIIVSDVINKSLSTMGKQNDETCSKILEFIRQRIKNLLETEGVRYDVADAVIGVSTMIPDTYCRAYAIKSVIGQDWFNSIVMVQDRISRIAAKAPSGEFDANLFDETEKPLFHAYESARTTLAQAKEKYNDSALRILSALSAPVADYFEKVLVMAPEPLLRNNRLSFLKALEGLYLGYADFQKIVL